MIEIVPDWLYLQSSLHPGKTALVLPDTCERVTYQEMAERVARVSGGLAELGIKIGDRVATLALNGLPQLELLFACARLGAILVPMSHRLTEPELCWIGSSAEPSLICYEEEFAAPAAAVAETTGARRVAIDAPGRGDIPYDTIRDAGAIPPLPLAPNTPWCILYTGGTTGQPKGAILTHSSVLWNAINTDLSWGLREEDIAHIFTPMFHTGGFNVFTLPLLLLGATIIVPKRFDPEQALRSIVGERATLLFLVPTMFQMLADAPGFEDADLSSIRWAISGGAPCPERLYDIYRRKVPVFKQGYGLTEVGPNNFATPDEDAYRKRGSIGRRSMMIRTRIVDPEGRDVALGEVGELWLSGPMVCAGYWRNREDSARAYDGEWFHTGDLVRCDGEGYYYIVDRKNDLIITGGENVYPKEVEEVLYGHPAVGEVAVVGVPHPLWGETVVAALSLKPGASATVEELTEHCRARLARYKMPRRFEFWPAMPKSAAGKIMRSEVRRQLSDQ